MSPTLIHHLGLAILLFGLVNAANPTGTPPSHKCKDNSSLSADGKSCLVDQSPLEPKDVPSCKIDADCPKNGLAGAWCNGGKCQCGPGRYPRVPHKDALIKGPLCDWLQCNEDKQVCEAYNWKCRDYYSNNGYSGWEKTCQCADGWRYDLLDRYCNFPCKTTDDCSSAMPKSECLKADPKEDVGRICKCISGYTRSGARCVWDSQTANKRSSKIGLIIGIVCALGLVVCLAVAFYYVEFCMGGEKKKLKNQESSKKSSVQSSKIEAKKSSSTGSKVLKSKIALIKSQSGAANTMSKETKLGQSMDTKKNSHQELKRGLSARKVTAHKKNIDKKTSLVKKHHSTNKPKHSKK